MKTRWFLFFVLCFLLPGSTLLAGCAAPSTPADGMPTSVPITLPTAVEKVAVLSTATAAPDPTATPTPVTLQTSASKAVAGALEKVLQTKAGDLKFITARFVDEVHGTLPDAGCNILLVTLARADGAPIDVEQFRDAALHFLIRGEDGSESVGAMFGMVGDSFVVGFQVPQTIKTYLLVWPDQAVTDITAEIETR